MRVVIWMTLKCRPDKSVKVSLTTCVSPKIILCHTMELNERVSEAYNADIGHLELNQQNYAIAVLYVFEAWYNSSGTMKKSGRQRTNATNVLFSDFISRED